MNASDHVAAIAEKDREIERLRATIREMAEVSGSEIILLKADHDALRAEVERIHSKALDSDNIAMRLRDAQDYGQRYLTADVGRIVWHAILDDAIRLRAQLAEAVAKQPRIIGARKELEEVREQRGDVITHGDHRISFYGALQLINMVIVTPWPVSKDRLDELQMVARQAGCVPNNITDPSVPTRGGEAHDVSRSPNAESPTVGSASTAEPTASGPSPAPWTREELEQAIKSEMLVRLPWLAEHDPDGAAEIAADIALSRPLVDYDAAIKFAGQKSLTDRSGRAISVRAIVDAALRRTIGGEK